MSGGAARAGPAPFSPLAVLGLVGIGTALFVALLWMIGAGMVHGPLNDGGSHGAGKGLTGYAALAALLERRGWQVDQARDDGALFRPGLLVLTPPANADGKELDRIVARRRLIGPTVLVTPKWRALPLGNDAGSGSGAGSGGRAGWVQVIGTDVPQWPGFLDDVTVRLDPMPGGRWFGDGVEGILPRGDLVKPRSDLVLSAGGDGLVPLIEGRRDGRILVAYRDDAEPHPALDALGLQGSAAKGDQSGRYPLVLVFEPDLLNNYGMQRAEAAHMALRLFEAAGAGQPRRVTFDLSLNGFRRKANLLTLAFTPPFLAATLCLLLAALILGWRAFIRFGPPLDNGPAIAFGKRQLVTNMAGLVRRSGRLHLLGGPYAALVRTRLARSLALPRQTDMARTEAAIDRALVAKSASGVVSGALPEATSGVGHDLSSSAPFSEAAARLRAARRPADLLRAVRALHECERMLQP